MTAVLGHLAIAVPEGGGLGNLPFVAIMIGLTSVAVVVNILHPIAWSDDEMRFAVVAPAGLGGLVALGAIALGRATTPLVQSVPARRPTSLAALAGGLAVTPLHVAVGLVLLSLAVYVAFVLAGRAGFGPLAAAPDPSDPAALLPAAGAPAARGLAAAGRPTRRCRSPGWPCACSRSRSAIYVVSVHPVGVHRGSPDHRELATRPRRPDARRADPRDVRLPQQPDPAARGVVAVVGLAVRPQARVVLPGGLRRIHDRGDL